jgi:hydrogenase small subunit
VHLDREPRWDIHHHTPTGWASERGEPGPVREAGHRFYDKLRRTTDTSRHDGEVWGRRTEWTEAKDPSVEPQLPRDGGEPVESEVGGQG